MHAKTCCRAPSRERHHGSLSSRSRSTRAMSFRSRYGASSFVMPPPRRRSIRRPTPIVWYPRESSYAWRTRPSSRMSSSSTVMRPPRHARAAASTTPNAVDPCPFSSPCHDRDIAAHAASVLVGACDSRDLHYILALDGLLRDPRVAVQAKDVASPGRVDLPLRRPRRQQRQRRAAARQKLQAQAPLPHVLAVEIDERIHYPADKHDLDHRVPSKSPSGSLGASLVDSPTSDARNSAARSSRRLASSSAVGPRSAVVSTSTHKLALGPTPIRSSTVRAARSRTGMSSPGSIASSNVSTATRARPERRSRTLAATCGAPPPCQRQTLAPGSTNCPHGSPVRLDAALQRTPLR